jgi:hypothetical protein
MREIATALGFTYNRRGCSCSGSPYIYMAYRNSTHYELTIYESRNFWKLTANNTQVADGDSKDLEKKIKQIWD